MKIRVNFPVEVDLDDVALNRLFGDLSPQEMRNAVKIEAEYLLIDHLEKNGVSILIDGKRSE